MKSIFLIISIILIQINLYAELRVGLFPGTLDPPHKGHISLVSEIAKKYNLDKVFVLPNPVSPHKPNATPYEIRKEMVIAAFSDLAQFEYLPEELAQAYHKQGLHKFLSLLMNQNHDIKLFQIMGSDAFVRYLKENDSYNGKILTNPNYEMIIDVRFKEELKQIPNAVKFDLMGKMQWVRVNKEGITLDANYSSTKIRNLIASDGYLGDLITKDTLKIIHRESLYKNKNSNCKKVFKD